MCVLFLLVLPALAGQLACGKTGKNRIISGYLFGSFAEWAFIQLIAVPAAIFRRGFSLVYYVILAVLCCAAVWGGILLLKGGRRFHPKGLFRERKVSDYLVPAVMIAGLLLLSATIWNMQHTDYDDSRFVVNAVDMIRTDRMFLTNPSTGRELAKFSGDMHRDAVSPWAVYIAFVSRATGVHATIMAHSILPQSLTLCMFCVYWLLAQEMYGDDLFRKSAFVIIAFMVVVHGVYSAYSSESFATLRLWQGKAVVASVGIPLLFLLFWRIYRAPDAWSGYRTLYLACFALCLMSSMGIIIGGILCGVFGLAYGILLRRAKAAWRIWIGMAVCLGYYGIYLLKW